MMTDAVLDKYHLRLFVQPAVNCRHNTSEASLPAPVSRKIAASYQVSKSGQEQRTLMIYNSAQHEITHSQQ